MTATAGQLQLVESTSRVKLLGRGGRLLMLEFVMKRGAASTRDVLAEWPAIGPTEIQRVLDSMVATDWLAAGDDPVSHDRNVSLKQEGISHLERVLREHWDWQVPAPAWDVELAIWEAGCIKYTQPRESQLRLLLELLKEAREENSNG